MPDLLIELFSEEIPARMQARAAEDLKKLVTDRLVAAGLLYEGAKAFATPRRLALAVQGVPVRQPDAREEKKGPRVGSPEGAIKGFLRAAGLASIEQAKIEKDPKKGDFYVAVIEKPGRAAIEVIGEIVPEVVKGFPWPKSMRWGEASATPGALNWVRPLHSIIATFGPETEEPDIVPFTVGGIAAGDETRGHRFLAPAPFKVKRLDDYAAKLEKAKVVLDPERRREIILADAKNLAFAQGFELVEDKALLDEVAGLVEWPVVLMGSFEEEFLSIPDEVIRATIRVNQKCFVLRDPATAKLVNKFILVSNIEAEDGGAAVIAGNERVIRARLSDAKFFYETDLKTRLEDRLPKFEQIVFHEKLGTQADRIARIELLARSIGEIIEPQKEVGKLHYRGSMAQYHNDVRRAAHLCKADLLTEVVGEFPEVQGLMGRYYAEAQGEHEAVAHAIEDHYRPKGPDDRVPADPVSVAVALADKIDTLVGFRAIDEKPTGSKDPYALRRAAVGVIRLIVDNGLRIRLVSIITRHMQDWLLSEAVALDRIYNYFVDIKENQEAVRLVELDEFFKNTLAMSFLAHDGIAQVIYANFDAAIRARQSSLPRDPSIDTFIQKVFTIWDFIEFTSPSYRGKAEELLIDAEDLTSAHGRWQSASEFVEGLIAKIARDLLAFFADRLKVQLREQGARHDLVDAVFALEGQDDLLLIVRRVEALGKFLDTEDGKSLLAGTKRATNIIRIEEKKDARQYVGKPDPQFYRQEEEWALAKAIDTAKAEASEAVAREDYSAAMSAMAKLRPHVDAFFGKVTVNVAEGADKDKLRENRLKLLNEIREATRAVADFSKIEG